MALQNFFSFLAARVKADCQHLTSRRRSSSKLARPALPYLASHAVSIYFAFSRFLPIIPIENGQEIIPEAGLEDVLRGGIRSRRRHEHREQILDAESLVRSI